MLKSFFSGDGQQSIRQVLFLGAHSDDIEIGCGGTILALTEAFPDLNIYWVVLSSTEDRREEALASANAFLQPVKGKKVLVQDFPDTLFPYVGAEIKNFFNWLGKEVSPDLIFTHYRQDLHQDHRLVSELTWNTFRNHMILEYEIPKYDGDLGNPNFFVHLNDSNRQKKIAYLMQHFQTQSNKVWFTEITFTSILRIRGIESNSPTQYAEGFYCRKAILL